MKQPPTGASVVRTYYGRPPEAIAAFEADAALWSKDSWFPTGHEYVPGVWRPLDAIIAIALCLFIIGFALVAYMLVVQPAGVLVATYVYRPQNAAVPTAA